MSASPYAPFAVIGAAGLLTLLVCIFGFTDTGTVVPIEINFGMMLDATAGPEIKVWVKTPLPAYVHIVVSNVSKREDDGTVTLGVEMFELFPTDDSINRGGGYAEFSMTLIDPSEEPVLNTTMAMVPMILKRDVPVGAMQNTLFMMTAFSLNNWENIHLGIIIVTIGMLITGILMLLREKKNEKATTADAIISLREE